MARARTRLSISFDDLNDSIYTIAYPSLAAVGIKATLYSSPVYVDAANKFTLAQVQEVYDAGWDVAIQQYNDADDAFTMRTDTGLTRSTTTATFSSGTDHLLKTGDYVEIRYSANSEWNTTWGPITVTNSTDFTFTCAGTETTPAIGRVEARRVGMEARVSREAAEASVTTVQDYWRAQGMTRALEHLAPAQGQISPTVVQWMDELGIKTLRSTATQSGFTVMPRMFDLLSLYPTVNALTEMNTSTLDQATAAAALGYIDVAIKSGCSLTMYGHKIAAGAGTGTTLTMDETEWDAFVAGVALRRSRGLLETCTISELYAAAAGLANRVRR